MSTRAELIEAVRRVVVATSRQLEVVAPAQLGRLWRRAELVLVGVDAIEVAARLEPIRRPGVYVVALGAPPVDGWRLAVGLGAEDVLVLPGADDWLVERLRSADSLAAGAPVLGVVGGRGGAGASFLAAALASCGAARMEQRPSALVDLDRFGGGIDLLLGSGDSPGLRWPELGDMRGRVPWDSLRGSLPECDGVTVVTFHRSVRAQDPDPAAVRAVVGAARTGCGLVVVDLPRGDDRGLTALLDRVVVVTTADVRGALAARSVVREVREGLDDVVLALRRPVRGGLPLAVVEEAVGLIDAVELPEISGADRRVARGRSAFGTGASVRTILDRVLVDLPVVPTGRVA